MFLRPGPSPFLLNLLGAVEVVSTDGSDFGLHFVINKDKPAAQAEGADPPPLKLHL